MMIKKILFTIFCLVGLVYVLIPSPNSINQFPPLPRSIKSDYPGDTYQVSNVAGYFSSSFRNEVIDYYKKAYQKLTLTLPFFPIRLNYQPEFSYTAIKDQTESTYLEELVYPLKDSLFINGFEPYYQASCELASNCPSDVDVYKLRRKKYDGATPIVYNGITYDTKATIRYYPSPPLARVLIWIGVCLSVIGLYRVGRRIYQHE